MPEMEHDGTKLHSGGSCNVNNIITNNLKHHECATCKTICLFVFRSICLEGQMLYQCSVENSKHGLYLAKLNTLEILVK